MVTKTGEVSAYNGSSTLADERKSSPEESWSQVWGGTPSWYAGLMQNIACRSLSIGRETGRLPRGSRIKRSAIASSRAVPPTFGSTDPRTADHKTATPGGCHFLTAKDRCFVWPHGHLPAKVVSSAGDDPRQPLSPMHLSLLPVLLVTTLAPVASGAGLKSLPAFGDTTLSVPDLVLPDGAATDTYSLPPSPHPRLPALGRRAVVRRQETPSRRVSAMPVLDPREQVDTRMPIASPSEATHYTLLVKVPEVVSSK